MFNVRLAGGHLYGKQLFTWLSLVVSLMAPFCAVLFPLDVLDEIWDLIESVSEKFLTYLCYSHCQGREIKKESSGVNRKFLSRTDRNMGRINLPRGNKIFLFSFFCRRCLIYKNMFNSQSIFPGLLRLIITLIHQYHHLDIINKS